MAGGLISETHPPAVGVAGSFGMPHVNRLLGEADCVLFIGTKAGQGATLNWTLPRPEAPMGTPTSRTRSNRRTSCGACAR
jgi:acetolactate synthase-1/2/3 large subunit